MEDRHSNRNIVTEALETHISYTDIARMTRRTHSRRNFRDKLSYDFISDDRKYRGEK